MSGKDDFSWGQVLKGAFLLAQGLTRASIFRVTVSASSLAVRASGDVMTRRCANWHKGGVCGVWAESRVVGVHPDPWSVSVDIASCGACLGRFRDAIREARHIVVELPLDWSGDILEVARVQCIMDA